jgi:hypothetical protein
MSLCQCGCGGEANRIFISGHNRKGHRKSRASFLCIQCGAVVETMKSRSKLRKYCSVACRDEHRRSLTGSPDHPSRSRITTKCWICHSAFEATPYRIKNGATCSMECGREARKRKMRGVRRRYPSRKTNWRKEARERDGHKCRVCGFHEVIHTHHIHPKRKGGGDTLDNFITVCPNHHAMIHAGMLTEEALRAVISSPTSAQMGLNLGRVVNFRN